MTTIDLDKAVALFRGQGNNVLADALQGSTQALEVACRSTNFSATEGQSLAVTIAQTVADTLKGSGIGSVAVVDTHAHEACAMGGKCNGACKSCRGSANGMLPGTYGDAWGQMVQMLQARGCGLACRPMSPCFLWALQMMLTRISLRTLYWMLERDDDSVEINTFCGDTTDFVDITTTPLVGGKMTLLTMSPAQQLPVLPAISKAAVTWEGDPIDSGVVLQLWQGPKGLQGIKLADLPTVLIPVGQSKNLTRWFCKDRCFVRPWPPFLGCSGGVIPDTEAIYLQITTDNTLGASKLKALPFEVLKSGTFDAGRWCGDCGVSVDGYGVPANIPSQLL